MDTVHNSHDAVRLVYPVLYGLDHEEAWVIFLTTCNGVIAAEMLSKGTLTNTAIDSRTILRQALLHNAASIILCHNHPSGNERVQGLSKAFTDVVEGISGAGEPPSRRKTMKAFCERQRSRWILLLPPSAVTGTLYRLPSVGFQNSAFPMLRKLTSP